MIDKTKLLDEVVVTVGQLVIDAKNFDKKKRLRHSNGSEVWKEAEQILYVAREAKSNFVVFPELAIPRSKLSYLEEWAKELGAVVIAGLEYGPKWCFNSDRNEPLVNEACVIIPPNLRTESKDVLSKYGRPAVFYIPKMNYPLVEATGIQKNSYSYREKNELYVFESSLLGNFAVLICYDFMSLSIEAMLQGNIQTLFVIAYNKDLNTYDVLANALVRRSMANVVITNSGSYGGSLVFSPYSNRHKRQVFKIEGNNVGAGVSVKIPMAPLKEVQQNPRSEDNKSDKERVFLLVPPNFGGMRIRSKHEGRT